MSGTWITVDDLKSDQSLDGQTFIRDDAYLQTVVDAAMDFVQSYRPDLNYTGSWTVPARVRLGAIRLAAHWSVRQSIDLGDMGERIATKGLDQDIYLQLGIKRPSP